MDAANQIVNTAPYAVIMYAPRTNQDFHCGRKSTYKNRLGCFRSTTRSTPVTTRNSIATKPSTICRFVETAVCAGSGDPRTTEAGPGTKYRAAAAARNPPAAID